MSDGRLALVQLALQALEREGDGPDDAGRRLQHDAANGFPGAGDEADGAQDLVVVNRVLVDACQSIANLQRLGRKMSANACLQSERIVVDCMTM